MSNFSGSANNVVSSQTPSFGRRNFIRKMTSTSFAAAALAASGERAIADAPRPDEATPGSHTFLVTDFGAVGDGKTMSTVGLQRALDTCGQAGGGRVVVPPGTFLTGPLFLRSNLVLELNAGSVLLGHTHFDEYPTIQGRWEGNDRTVFASLLTGEDLENVTITGRGSLNGNGQPWRDAQRQTNQARKAAGLHEREPENPAGSALKWPRPRMINLYRSKNILISGISILDSPSWNVHPVLCENINIDGVTIVSPKDSLNTDGIDPESCKQLRIANCYISTGDDCIILKSGYKYVEGKTLVPTQNVTITNCVFGFGQSGVGIGSETAGGVRDVTISNCVCDGTRRGLYFKTGRGRGASVENVRVNNYVMRNLVDTALWVSMWYVNGDRDKAEPVGPGTPAMRNIHCSDMIVSGTKRAALIEGLPERPIEGLQIDNFHVEGATTGIDCMHVDRMVLNRATVNVASGPAATFHAVHDLELQSFRTDSPSTSDPAVRMNAVQDVLVASCRGTAARPVFLEVSGDSCADVQLSLNRMAPGVREVALAGGANASAIRKLT
jgi:polygalacturonase